MSAAPDVARCPVFALVGPDGRVMSWAAGDRPRVEADVTGLAIEVRDDDDPLLTCAVSLVLCADAAEASALCAGVRLAGQADDDVIADPFPWRDRHVALIVNHDGLPELIRYGSPAEIEA